MTMERHTVLFYFWEAIKYMPPLITNSSSSICIVIRAFVGGRESVQVQPFFIALSDFIATLAKSNVSVVVEYLNCDDVKKRKMDPAGVIDWLLNSHIHFILSHIHQGIIAHLEWDMENVHKELLRLKFHCGFPNRSQLSCPIFTQNKYEYIRCSGRFCNNTMKIDLTESGEQSLKVIEEISNFMQQNNQDSRNQWVVKAPYTTNSEFRKYVTSLDQVLDQLKVASRKYFGRISYVMLQERMHNPLEQKIVLFNGKVHHLARIRQRAGGSKAFVSDQNQVFEFAEHALLNLKSNCPYIIADGLVRVDIFEKAPGVFVVNEFESLEANYYTTQIQTENKCTLQLTQYWYSKLIQLSKLFYDN